MNTEDLLNSLIYYHLQEFSSDRELIQALQEEDSAKDLVADRGTEQLLHVFTELQKRRNKDKHRKRPKEEHQVSNRTLRIKNGTSHTKKFGVIAVRNVLLLLRNTLPLKATCTAIIQ